MAEQKQKRSAVDWFFRGLEIVIAIFLAVMIALTFMNVVLRQFGKGFAWSEEITRICFIYLIYLGSIIAARENQHLMIDTLMTKLPQAGQKILYIVIQLLTIALMAFFSVGAATNAWNNRSDFWVATHFPVFMVHIIGAVMGVSMILIALVDIYRVTVKKEDALTLFTTHGTGNESLEEQEGGGIQ